MGMSKSEASRRQQFNAKGKLMLTLHKHRVRGLKRVDWAGKRDICYSGLYKQMVSCAQWKNMWKRGISYSQTGKEHHKCKWAIRMVWKTCISSSTWNRKYSKTSNSSSFMLEETGIKIKRLGYHSYQHLTLLCRVLQLWLTAKAINALRGNHLPKSF